MVQVAFPDPRATPSDAAIISFFGPNMPISRNRDHKTPQLFPTDDVSVHRHARTPMQSERLPRLDTDSDLRSRILPLCRLSLGEIWTDPVSGHRVGVIDARDPQEVR